MVNLLEHGWEKVDVDSDTGVASEWRKKGPPPVQACLRVMNTGEVSGAIDTHAEPSDGRVHGNLVLHDLQSLDDAASRMDKLLSAVTIEPPRRLHLITTDDIQIAAVG